VEEHVATMGIPKRVVKIDNCYNRYNCYKSYRLGL